MYLSLHGYKIFCDIQIARVGVCTSATMLIASNGVCSVLCHLYTIFFPAYVHISHVRSLVKDLPFRENSGNGELCISVWKRLIADDPKYQGCSEKCIMKCRAADDCPFGGHQRSMK